MLYPAGPASARLRHGPCRSLYSLTIEVMAGLSLSTRTLRIRVSFYEIVKLHGGTSNLGPTRPEVVIPLNSHEIFRAIVPPVKTYFLETFPCSEARVLYFRKHGFSLHLRPAQSRFCSSRVCNGHRPSGPVYPGEHSGRRGAPVS